MPVAYDHILFTLPAAVGAIAFHNKVAVYDLLFGTAAETLISIAADPRHLGARIGLTSVLHTRGSAPTIIRMCTPGQPRTRSARTAARSNQVGGG